VLARGASPMGVVVDVQFRVKDGSEIDYQAVTLI
jgi:hypothetical protein